MTDKSRRFGNLSPERLPYCGLCGMCALTEGIQGAFPDERGELT